MGYKLTIAQMKKAPNSTYSIYQSYIS